MQTAQILFHEEPYVRARKIVEIEPDVSFVMTALKEAAKRLCDVARQLGVKYEPIVVDDGSLDGTLIKVMDYPNNNNCMRVMSYVKNMGKGFAVKTGFCHTKGDSVVFIVSDLDIESDW